MLNNKISTKEGVHLLFDEVDGDGLEGGQVRSAVDGEEHVDLALALELGGERGSTELRDLRSSDERVGLHLNGGMLFLIIARFLICPQLNRRFSISARGYL